MEKVKVHISWLNNYGACCDLVPGCIATHKTLEGVKQGFREALEWHLAAMKEDGDDIPEALQGDYELHFALDAQALLHHYDGILTRTAISHFTGISPKQLGHYMQGIRNPRKEQRERIVNGLHKLGKELELVE